MSAPAPDGPLSRLTGPVRFASREGGRMLRTVRGLGPLVVRALGEAAGQCDDLARRAELASLARAFEHFERASLADRYALLGRLAPLVGVEPLPPGGAPDAPGARALAPETGPRRQTDAADAGAGDGGEAVGTTTSEPAATPRASKARRPARASAKPRGPAGVNGAGATGAGPNGAGANGASVSGPSVATQGRLEPLSLRELGGVGPKTAAALTEAGLGSPRDLLLIAPSRWEDRRRVVSVAEAQSLLGVSVAVAGVVSARRALGPRGSRGVMLTLEDAEARGAAQARLTVRWMYRTPILFNEAFDEGRHVLVYGEVREWGGSASMMHPAIVAEAARDELVGRVLPVYGAIEGVPAATLRRAIHAALDALERYGAEAVSLSDAVPREALAAASLPSLVDALRTLHRPAGEPAPAPREVAPAEAPAPDGSAPAPVAATPAAPSPDSAPAAALDDDALTALVQGTHPAQRRLAFDELFYLQLALALRRRGARALRSQPFAPAEGAERGAADRFPFALTGAQRRSLAEIAADFRRGVPMTRLLQGDVGSGKTAVALGAALLAIEGGTQAAILAPTEVLAEQHFAGAERLFEALGLRARLLTGSLRAAERRRVVDAASDGRADLVVGTHALLSGDVRFARLGLAVIDEQHRFGVTQRALLRQKGSADDVVPHVLVMTATPIPRSLAMAVYGDLELSLLDELPPGRTPIRTEFFEAARRADAYARLAAEVEAGGRAYVLVPAIGDLDGAGAADGAPDGAEERGRDARPTIARIAAELEAGVLRGRRLGVLHGQLPPWERGDTLRAFASGTLDVLVCTTVVEVGIDVPEATAILIEQADRFGLSQLHQLRGRVGRGARAGHCLLVGSGAQTDASRRRLDVLCATTDGFRIAEEDLAIRGPGELLGTRQAGLPSFRYADLVRDLPLLREARSVAQALVDADPALSSPANAALRRELVRRLAWLGLDRGEVSVALT